MQSTVVLRLKIMKLITLLYELSDVLGTLTDIDSVRLHPSTDNCKIVCTAEMQVSTYSKSHLFTVDAITNEAVDGLTDVVGIWPLQPVCGALKSPGMQRTTAHAIYKLATKVPMLELNDREGNRYEIALLREAMAREQIQVLPLKISPLYEVEFSPTEVGISLFKHWASEMRKTNDNNWFIPFTNNADQLVFRYQSDRDSFDFVIAQKVSGSFTADWKFRDKAVLQLIKHFRTSKSMTIKFYSKGLMTIELQTTLATYLFHFPAARA